MIGTLSFGTPEQSIMLFNYAHYLRDCDAKTRGVSIRSVEISTSLLGSGPTC